MGVDVTTITTESWHLNWPPQDVDIQFLRTGTLPQAKQSRRWVEYIGPEGQSGRPMPYVANKGVNLWGHDLLQQWNTQINIPAVSEMEHKPTHVSGKDIIGHYKKWSLAIKAVQKDKTTHRAWEVLLALPLKWLTKEPIWVKQCPLTE